MGAFWITKVNLLCKLTKLKTAVILNMQRKKSLRRRLGRVIKAKSACKQETYMTEKPKKPDKTDKQRTIETALLVFIAIAAIVNVMLTVTYPANPPQTTETEISESSEITRPPYTTWSPLKPEPRPIKPNDQQERACPND
jgi:hypothetical protein